MTRGAEVSPSRRAIRKLPQLVAARGGRVTIETLGRLSVNFVVVFNAQLVGEFQPKESLCFDVSIDGLEFENDQGS